MLKVFRQGILILILLIFANLRHADAALHQLVWIDTDPAVGEYQKDVDDGLALIQSFNSNEIKIEGISTVFGNTQSDKSFAIAKELVHRFGPKHILVSPGASSPSALGIETPATRALAKALARGKLSILALGPLTNIATVIQNHPELINQIGQVIAVAGRRPGQRFLTGTYNKKPHRDLNFELDVPAFKTLLESKIKVVLTPFELSSQVWIKHADVKRMKRSGPASRWLSQPSNDWLEYWERNFKVDGFNPFDTLAVGYLVNPKLMSCDTLTAEIQYPTEPALNRVPIKESEIPFKSSPPARASLLKKQSTDPPQPQLSPQLIVSKQLKSTRKVVYCHTVSPKFKPDLMLRLLH